MYRGRMLGLLLTLLVFSSADGIALGLVLQEIKIDLLLSDTQLGLLTGLAFSLFYAVMGIPIARWADRGDRVVIIGLSACLWSLLVAACGMAGSFWQLMLIRAGVAVGEAGCVPPAHSLIADTFNRSERPRAVGIYMLGGPLSMVVGYFGAGWLDHLFGWRAMFAALGLPGLIPAIAAWLTLREPRRKSRHAPRASGSLQEAGAADQAPLRAVALALWRNRSFRRLLLAYSILSFFGVGILQWQPTYFVRTYHLPPQELGLAFALIYGLGGVVGTYLGGAAASRFAAGKDRTQLVVMAGLACLYGVLLGGVYLVHDLVWALGLMAAAVIGGALTSGPLFGLIQSLVPPSMRATSIALIYFSANLIGAGLGPLAVGSLSDLLSVSAGGGSLRIALIALCPGYLWAAWFLWRASGSVTADLATVVDEGAAPDVRAVRSVAAPRDGPEARLCP